MKEVKEMIVVTLIFLLLIFSIGILLANNYYDNTCVDIRWLIGEIMITVSIFQILLFISNAFSTLVEAL